MATNDRLVRLWYPRPHTERTDYDFQYIAHTTNVKRFEWKIGVKDGATSDTILFTTAADNICRIWAPMISTQPYQLFLWAIIDPSSNSVDISPSPVHYLDLSDLVKVQAPADEDISVESKESIVVPARRLKSLLNHACDLFYQLDANGKLILWAIDAVGPRAMKIARPYAVLQIANVVELSMSSFFSHDIRSFTVDNGTVSLIAIGSSGVLAHFKVDVLKLFDQDASQSSMLALGVMHGHTDTISRLVRTADGRAICSTGTQGETFIWRRHKPKGLVGPQQLRLQSSHNFEEEPSHLSIFHSGRHLLALQSGQLHLWHIHQNALAQMAALPGMTNVNDISLLLTLSDESSVPLKPAYAIAVCLDKMVYVWKLTFTDKGQSVHADLLSRSSLPMDDRDGDWSIVPVDPMGWIRHATSTSLDDLSQDLFMTASHATGVLSFWRPTLLPRAKSDYWSRTGKVKTFREQIRLIRCSSAKKSAVVSATPEGDELTIWDSKSSQFSTGLEFSCTFDSSVNDLDWTCTPDSQSILAVGFSHRVVLYAQRRIEHLTEGDAWVPIHEITTNQLSPDPIADSIWLEDGGLVVSTGSKLLTFSKHMDSSFVKADLGLGKHIVPMDTIFDVVFRLNGPLPQYHPHFLLRCILAGKLEAVKKVVVRMYDELQVEKWGNKAPDVLLMLEPETFLSSERATSDKVTSNSTAAKYQGLFDEDDKGSNTDVTDSTGFSQKVVDFLSEYMSRLPLPYLSNVEQIELLSLINALLEVETQRRSLDEDGQRFYILVRRFVFTMRMSARRGMRTGDLKIRDIVWAYHSDSQDLLLEVAKQAVGGERYTWAEARKVGIFLWLRNPTHLKQEMENIARNQYMLDEDRDPTKCSLFYLALRKKKLLQGLWKTTGFHKEQAVMIKFLSNDFNEPRWRTAAMKNAYALLGKQRYEYAAAFFILGDSLRDAVNICLKHLNDYQLAISITRVYEGDNGPVLKEILAGTLLPQAVESGDRWFASWTLWMLGRRDLSVKATMMPLQEVYKEQQGSVNGTHVQAAPKPTHFSRQDPGLILLYQRLRQKSLQTVKGALEISLKTEFDFVLHTARTLGRMGCDILALDLVSRWDFGSAIDALASAKVEPSVVSPTSPGPPTLIGMRERRRSSIVDDFGIKRRNTIAQDTETVVTAPPVAGTPLMAVPPSKGFNLLNTDARAKTAAPAQVNAEFNLDAFDF